MLNLDDPWKIVALVAALAVLRLIAGLTKGWSGRQMVIELLDAGLIAFVLVFLLIRPLVVQAFFIPSGSMHPTLVEGDRILVNKFIYRLNSPHPGDVIVFQAPPKASPDQKDFIKRLIGEPGDRILIRRGIGVTRNGSLLTEPYIAEVVDYDFPEDGRPFVVPKGTYFVMGDNRNDSNDSHKWGSLPADRVIGKAVVTFWPFGRIGLIH